MKYIPSYRVLFLSTKLFSMYQIFIKYFRSFAEERKKERLRFLSSNYDFNCSCEACSKNWPVFNGLAERGTTLIEGR